MERTDEEIRDFLVTADAIRELGIEAADHVEAGDYPTATATLGVLTEIAYALATTMQRAAANDLKVKHLPEDLIKSTLPPPGNEQGSGNYL